MTVPPMLAVFLSLVLSRNVIGQGGGIVNPGEDEKHLQGCVIPTTKVLMAFNETLTLQDNCLLMTCRKDRTIEYKHCIAPEVPHHCTLSDYNTSLTYPECCPALQCDNQEKKNETVPEIHVNQIEVPITNQTTADNKTEEIDTNVTTERNHLKPMDAKDVQLPVEVRRTSNPKMDRVRRNLHQFYSQSNIPNLSYI